MATTLSRPTLERVGIRRWSRTRWREAIEGYLYLMPWLLGLLIFYAGPMVASFVLSFTKYDVVRSPEFIGLSNYEEAFTEDSLFWSSLGRTFYYAVVMVPASLVASLLIALLLNRGLVATGVLRTVFFLPSLTPVVAAAFVWRWILNPDVGPINYTLWKMGIQGPGWFTEHSWVIPSLMIVALWMSAGGTRMLIFLASLQGVPEELYEAADMDGANNWHKFWHVTLPMISPALLFNLILGVIGALQVFTSAYTATGGGPGRASWFFSLHVYTNAFEFFYMGYASALAWLFLAVILVLTYLNFRSSQRWVYYEGGIR